MTEGVQFPGVDQSSRLGRATRAAADCETCQWTIAPSCLQGDATENALCFGATDGCANPDDVRYRVYFRPDASSPWELVDTVCLGPDDRPLSVADLAAAVRERVITLLPDADPTYQPPGGAVVNLPTLFAAGEPRRIDTEPFDVLGFTVVVTATARWEWTFERGVTEQFTEPGGPYPDQSVAHTYERKGTRQVSVTTYWRASFTVDGEGPYAVPGPEISKTAGPIEVPVREGRSVLIGG